MTFARKTAVRSERYLGRSNVLVLRFAYASRRTWWGFVTGFLEPLFYLATLGPGLGPMVGGVEGPDGRPVSYVAFIAPALLAATTMNAAFHDLSVGFFYRLRHARLYEAVLATPTGVIDLILGEALWAAIRATLYAAAFLAAMVAMGATSSPWALAALPVAFVLAFAFGLVALAATTFMRSWSDTQLVQVVTVPMLLFAATFFPLGVYPGWLQPVVEAMPLYQANVLMRSVVGGVWSSQAAFAVAYLTVLGGVGAFVATRRLERFLLT